MALRFFDNTHRSVLFATFFYVFISVGCNSPELTQSFEDGKGFKKTINIQRPKAEEPRYIYVPFEVPEDTESVSISYEYDKNHGANKIELGVFDTEFSGENNDKKGLRGWSGSVRDSIFIAKESATHGYVPGEIQTGKWHIIFGLALVEDDGVSMNLTVRFDQIDEKAKREYDEETKREFSFKKKEKAERLKTGDLTWYAGDLHSHTFHSDGRWSVKGILESAASNNLDFVSITEHNTHSHHTKIDDLASQYPGITILKGEEVTTYGGHINVWGLAAGQWVDFRVSPNTEESAKKIVAEAEKLGGIASINHPKMDCAGCGWTYGKWGNLAAVEVWNATWDEQDENALIEWENLLLNGVKITGIGSTDSHQRPEEPSKYPTNLPIGEPAVFVGAKRKTGKALLEAIKSGRVFVAENSARRMSLTANDKVTVGGTVEASYGDTIEFKFSLEGFGMGTKLWLIANGQVAKELLIYDSEYSGTYNIYAKQGGYVRLEVRSANNKMLGFTNPVYFRVK